MSVPHTHTHTHKEQQQQQLYYCSFPHGWPLLFYISDGHHACLLRLFSWHDDDSILNMSHPYSHSLKTSEPTSLKWPAAASGQHELARLLHEHSHDGNCTLLLLALQANICWLLLQSRGFFASRPLIRGHFNSGHKTFYFQVLLFCGGR